MYERGSGSVTSISENKPVDQGVTTAEFFDDTSSARVSRRDVSEHDVGSMGFISEPHLCDERVTTAKKMTTPAVRIHLACGLIYGVSRAVCLGQISATMRRWRH